MPLSDNDIKSELSYAYWVSLYGAAPSGNQNSQRVFVPKKNRFTVPALEELLRCFAREEVIRYDS
jgi:hypothetical protein